MRHFSTGGLRLPSERPNNGGVPGPSWRLTGWLLLAALAGCGQKPAPAQGPAGSPPVAAGQLRSPDDFSGIADAKQRSAAIFLEASRVLTHPRCVNCHPGGDSPLQGDKEQLHEPPVVRGDHDQGVVGMHCSSCHQDDNQAIARVPGAPNWRLADRSMAWQGKTPRQICEQLKDPAKNGHRTLAQIVSHSAHDSLVAWGWNPGHGRTPAPGTQAELGALMEGWVESGAVCPKRGARP